MKRKARQYTAKPVAATPRAGIRIAYDALAGIQADAPFAFEPPKLMPGVVPSEGMAMDAGATSIYAYANSGVGMQGFLGYPLLSELAQITEYRNPVETTALECTRTWIKFSSDGDKDLTDKIAKLNAAMVKYRVREVFKMAMEHDGFFGRAQIYISIDKVADDMREMPLIMSNKTIRPGSLLGFTNVEPLWTAPYTYNSNNPLAPDFFKPQHWFVMGKKIHSTRMLTIVGREVPDLLKPAYNFGGVSLTQLLAPYVSAWLRTRDAVSDLLHNFSITGIKTNMADVLQGGGDQGITNRAKLFNKYRDNQAVMLLDKDTEDIMQINTPLSGLDLLQAQSQEHMAGPTHMPLVKLFGITPSGLNASAEGEIQVYYDYIHSMQESLIRTPLQKIIEVIQLSEFGEIDDAIKFEFLPLKELDGEALARVRKADADAGMAYVERGVISAEEERQRLASDPQSGYTNLDPDDLPEAPGGETQGDDGMGNG